MPCLTKHGCRSVLDDNIEVAQELMPAIQPLTSPAGQAATPPSLGPPTPQSLDVGGDLPTIHEEDEERHAGELITESFMLSS